MDFLRMHFFTRKKFFKLKAIYEHVHALIQNYTEMGALKAPLSSGSNATVTILFEFMSKMILNVLVGSIEEVDFESTRLKVFSYRPQGTWRRIKLEGKAIHPSDQETPRSSRNDCQNPDKVPNVQRLCEHQDGKKLKVIRHNWIRIRVARKPRSTADIRSRL